MTDAAWTSRFMRYISYVSHSLPFKSVPACFLFSSHRIHQTQSWPEAVREGVKEVSTNEAISRLNAMLKHIPSTAFLLIQNLLFSFTTVKGGQGRTSAAKASADGLFLDFPICYGSLPPPSLNKWAYVDSLARTLTGLSFWPTLHDLCVDNRNFGAYNYQYGALMSLGCRCRGSKKDQLTCLEGEPLARNEAAAVVRNIAIWCHLFCACPADEEHIAMMNAWMDIAEVKEREQAMKNARTRPKKHTRQRQKFLDAYDLSSVFRKVQDQADFESGSVGLAGLGASTLSG